MLRKRENRGRFCGTDDTLLAARSSLPPCSFVEVATGGLRLFPEKDLQANRRDCRCKSTPSAWRREDLPRCVARGNSGRQYRRPHWLEERQGSRVRAANCGVRQSPPRRLDQLPLTATSQRHPRSIVPILHTSIRHPHPEP